MTRKPVIISCSTLSLSKEEISLIQDYQPWGLILFGRNIQSQPQVKELTDHFKSLVKDNNAPVLIDQEGGRVQRLAPPDWPQYPSMGDIAELYSQNSGEGLKLLTQTIQSISADLKACGINVNCAPVADLRLPNTDPVIGKRAFAADVETTTKLAGHAASVFLENSILPVLKHVPGYGRVNTDPHFKLPFVKGELKTLEDADFKPFKALSHIKSMMVAHICYEALNPTVPATQSPEILQSLIRDDWHYDGLLMTDDIMMQALQGDVVQRSLASWRAGMDIILHCSGKIQETTQLLENTPIASEQTARRMREFQDQLTV